MPKGAGRGGAAGVEMVGLYGWFAGWMSRVWGRACRGSPREVVEGLGGPVGRYPWLEEVADRAYPGKASPDGGGGRLTLPDLQHRGREEKRRQGQFYTPEDLVRRVLAATGLPPADGNLLDPACGDGAWLVPAAEAWVLAKVTPSLERLWGFDLDAEALLVCLARLAAAAPGGGWPHLEQRDFLRHPPGARFAAVVGNPPYRVNLDPELRKHLAEIYETAEGEKDLYTFFLEGGVKALIPGGTLAMLTSNTFLVNHQCARIREFLFRRHIPRQVFLMPVRFFPQAPGVLPVVLSLQAAGPGGSGAEGDDGGRPGAPDRTALAAAAAAGKGDCSPARRETGESSPGSGAGRSGPGGAWKDAGEPGRGRETGPAGGDGDRGVPGLTTGAGETGAGAPPGRELPGAPASRFGDERPGVKIFSMYKAISGWESVAVAAPGVLAGAGGIRQALIPEEMRRVFRAMEEGTRPLGELARIGVGIQESTVREGKVSRFVRERPGGADDVPVLRGREVGPFRIAWEGKYLAYGPHLTYAGDPATFQGEKILYQNLRHESLPVRLVAAIDREGFFPKNSLSFIAQPVVPFSLAYLAGLLNSTLVNAWFAGRFFSFHVTVTQVRQIPVPEADDRRRRRVEEVAGRAAEVATGKGAAPPWLEELDAAVAACYLGPGDHAGVLAAAKKLLANPPGVC